MACGADGVELDVWATQDDDALVVTHDWPAAKRLGLEEVLALDAPDGFWLDIEAKSSPKVSPDAGRYASLLSAALKDHLHRVIVRSFDHAFLRAFHAIEPEVPLAALIAYASDDWVGIARAAGASVLSPLHSTVTAERVKKAHDAGIRVSVWTVNGPAAWDRLASLGVDTIITDDPCAAVRHFGG